jgi:RNA polymerase sigma-70 factor (ECF subfamily)
VAAGRTARVARRLRLRDRQAACRPRDSSPRALTAPLDALRGVAGDEPAVDRAYGHRADLAAARAALRTLPRADREALLLRAVAELSFADIAVLMKTSPAAVKMRISRARRKLADSIPEHSHGRRTHTA